MAFIAVLALEPIRRRWYEAFHRGHHLLGLVAVALSMVHSIGSRPGGRVSVTPMASLAAQFLVSRTERLKVVFVWASRSADAFFEWIPNLLHNPAFGVHLYCTAAKGLPDPSPTKSFPVEFEAPEASPHPVPTSDRLALAVTHGRPDWGQLFGPFADLGSDLAVLVCGPKGMVTAAQIVAQARRYRFHKEAFEL